MNNNLQNNQLNLNHDEEIDLGKLVNVIWDKKFYILAITSIFAIISIVYALQLPNIYRSTAELLPVESGSGTGGMLGQYAGMASLAGIELGGEQTTKSQEAVARIKSFEFFSKYFYPNIALEDFLAVKKWDLTSNTLIYDKENFNSESGQWVRQVSPPRSIIPSPQEAYLQYKAIMRIAENPKTSFVTLFVEHQSPFIAQKWVELILDQIDQVMRDADRREAMQSVKYLNSIAPTVNYEEIKKSLSSLQEEQIKRLMMIEANKNYIFKVLESPIVPELKSKPKRSLVVIMGTMLGGLLSVLGTLVLYYARRLPSYHEPSV